MSIISVDKYLFVIELFIKEIHSQMLFQPLRKQVFMKETLTSFILFYFLKLICSYRPIFLIDWHN